MPRSSRAVLLGIPVALLLVVVEVLLRTTSLPRSARLLGVPLAASGDIGPPLSAPLPRWCRPRLVAIEGVLRRWPPSDSCLRRSLLQAVLLRRLHPVIRLGWSPAPGGGNAHAWVEVGGESLDPDLDGILPFRET